MYVSGPTTQLWETMHLLLVLCLMVAAYLGSVYRQGLNMREERAVREDTASHADELMESNLHMPTDHRINSNNKRLEAHEELPDSLAPHSEKPDLHNQKPTETEQMDAKEEIPSLNLESVRDTADLDIQTQQLDQKESDADPGKATAPGTIRSQEAGEDIAPPIEEETQRGSSEPLKQADLPNQDVSLPKDPAEDSVDGASSREDQAPRERSASVDAPPETPEKKVEEVSPEEPKVELVIVDKDEPTKKIEDEKKDVAEKVEKSEEGKKSDMPQKEEEEMPSFDEWKQKMLEQHEQERQQGQAGKGNAAPPPRTFSLTENSKNHASSDCGAKILNVNKESQNAPAILQSNRDVYTLNPCSASIWFSVELCEPIQVKYIEIANYELFSSVPESFRVSISDRFPTREWRQLGTFHARDERSLQSFPVHEETMFAKYMKIEMLTFFGSEHYCPLSTLRVFGTSMVEEIDEENVASDSIHEDTEVLPAHPTQAPSEGDSGLLQSAKGLVRDLMNAITGNGNGKETPPCDGKNGSCPETEMLPCLPEDEPKEFQSERSNRSVTVEEAQQCNYQNTSDFSLDSARFDKECRGLTFCFSPNYGEKFQDCCVREVATSLTTHSFLCCKDMLKLSLYRSVRTPEPSAGQKDPLHPLKEVQHASQMKEQTGTSVDELKILSDSTTSNETSQQKLDSDKDPTPHQGTVPGNSLEVPPSGATSSASTSPSEIQRQSESQVRPTRSPSPPRAPTEAETGNMLPSPTPSLKPTCATMPVEHPETVLRPPINIQPAAVQGVREDQDLRGPEQMPSSEVQLVAKGTPAVSLKAEKVKTETTDPQPSAETDDSAKVGEQRAEVKNEQREKAPSEEASPKEPKTPVASSEMASKDSSAANKSDAANSPSKSGQAYATEKDSAKMPEADDTRKSIKTEAKETPEAELEPKSGDSRGKVPESAKPSETAGKGTKTLPDSGANGSSSIGSIAQKESVFMRLNNRIKSLELNMSLSSRYLEELSQRYRKRMDEMQKAFNKTIQALTENAQKAEEKDQKQQEYIAQLEDQMSEVMMNLEATNQRLESLHREVTERHLFLMVIEILLMSFIFLLCLRRLRKSRPVASHGPPVVVRSHDNGIRRNSHPSTPRRKEHEEKHLLPRVSQRTISGGSCDDLLIIGPSTPFLESLQQANEPARQKPKNKAKHKPLKSVSNPSVLQNHQPGPPAKRATKMTAAGVLFRGPAFGGGRTPPDSPTDSVHRTLSAEEISSRVQDVGRGAAPMKQQYPRAGGKHPAKKQGLMMNGRR
ncbi:SUN domain-containing ossification factor-like isoform X2 [Acanthaster planci]|uniref:SUN domain-containing ossification factor-like isoform X2 n=1 Tax=Acanthaster planci TaxID=133434 RepID=A0A8B7ZYX6_ACAPL|nr:SUN domain-containing ossification factor-like isoform X2 [Acanthaster planci]